MENYGRWLLKGWVWGSCLCNAFVHAFPLLDGTRVELSCFMQPKTLRCIWADDHVYSGELTGDVGAATRPSWTWWLASESLGRCSRISHCNAIYFLHIGNLLRRFLMALLYKPTEVLYLTSIVPDLFRLFGLILDISSQKHQDVLCFLVNVVHMGPIPEVDNDGNTDANRSPR